MLFDYYGELLTDKQKELFDLYYNEDLSLTEISEHAGISRQGVRDSIVRSEVTLRNCEEKLGFVGKYSGFEDCLSTMESIITDLDNNPTVQRNSDIKQHIGKMKELISEMK